MSREAKSVEKEVKDRTAQRPAKVRLALAFCLAIDLLLRLLHPWTSTQKRERESEDEGK